MNGLTFGAFLVPAPYFFPWVPPGVPPGLKSTLKSQKFQYICVYFCCATNGTNKGPDTVNGLVGTVRCALLLSKKSATNGTIYGLLIFLPQEHIACLVLTFLASSSHSHCRAGTTGQHTSKQNWRGGKQACLLNIYLYTQCASAVPATVLSERSRTLHFAS